MYLRKPNTRPHQLDVQETNVSIPQFFRVRHSFVGCWIAHGMDCLLSIFWDMVIEVLRGLQDKADLPKETCAGQETIPSIKTRSKHQLKRESERLSNCQMWISYPPTHILLKASLSCALLKTTRSCHQDDYQRGRSPV